MLSISLDTVYNLNQRGTEGGNSRGQRLCKRKFTGHKHKCDSSVYLNEYPIIYIGGILYVLLYILLYIGVILYILLNILLSI